jgi:hypothetical protein
MSINKIKAKFSNQTVGSWLNKMPNELEIDAIGLWQIIPAGTRNFCLAGEDLEQFTRRAIAAVLERGAVPARGIEGSGGRWRRTVEYGQTNAEIVNNIVSQWLDHSTREPDVGDVWFVLPKFIDEIL